MEEGMKICLVLSLIGILVLLFLSAKLEPQQKNISEITNADFNKEIKIIAKISSIREFPDKNFQIMTLKDETGNITAISSSNSHIELNRTKEYAIIGRVQEYNRTLQLNINRILE